MSQKLKCHQHLNVTKNRNVTNTEMSQKLKCYQNWSVTEIDMLQQLEGHQTEISLKLKLSPILKCHKNRHITKTEMLPKLKCHKILKCSQNQNQNLNLGDWPWLPWSCYIRGQYQAGWNNFICGLRTWIFRPCMPYFKFATKKLLFNKFFFLQK